jgi:hypothetical protein
MLTEPHPADKRANNASESAAAVILFLKKILSGAGAPCNRARRKTAFKRSQAFR